jgi:predicted esterase
MTPPDPPIVSVSGGSGGIDAHLDDMETTAALIGGLGLDMGELALVGHAHLLDPNVVASALLDPAGSARFEWAMLQALDGEGGLTTVAIGIGVSAVKLKVAAVTYRAVDELQAELMDVVEFLTAPVTFVVSLGTLAVITGGHVLEGESLSEATQHTITDHPGLVDDVVGSVPGLLASLAVVSPLAGLAWAGMGFPTSVPGGAAGLARLYPDGSPKVTPHGRDASVEGIGAPHNLTDIMEGLDRRNDASSEIDVRIIETVGPDGRVHRSAIVDIPGTKVWNTPGSSTNVLQDLGTNLHGVGNDTTTYERAVARALEQAGVQPGEPVMLVGHSQGGIVALHAATSFAESGRYNVTHVVTAGSPVGEVRVPESIHVLSIENRGDIVPHLESNANPDQSNWTTVTVDHDTGTVGGNHAMHESYVPAAGSVDHSTDPSVRAYMDSADAFLNGDPPVTTNLYGVERVP